MRGRPFCGKFVGEIWANGLGRLISKILHYQPYSGIAYNMQGSNYRRYIAGVGVPDEDKKFLLHRDETTQIVKAAIIRFTMAFFGGVALVGPMLVMTLHKSRNTSLITTSISVLFFAMVVAYFARKASPQEVLAATAAYAAVLVVFVGTSSDVPKTG